MKIIHQAPPVITHTAPLAKDVKFGECFNVSGIIAVYMRIRPVSWILNSSLIQDKLIHGYIFVVNVENGNFTTISGSSEVAPLDTQLQILSKK